MRRVGGGGVLSAWGAVVGWYALFVVVPWCIFVRMLVAVVVSIKRIVTFAAFAWAVVRSSTSFPGGGGW